MSKDLFLGTTKKNWARGACSAPLVNRPNLVLTSDEKKRLEKLAIVKMKSDAGDAKEKKHWQKLRGDLEKQRAKARRGDKKAARLVAVVDESGLFGQYQQTFAMRGEEKKFPNPFGDQTAKPLPRKPNPFAVETLADAARRGDVSAQIALRKLKIRAAADQEEREGVSGATEILGAFVGDEERAEGESCGATEILGAAEILGAIPNFRAIARRARKLKRRQRRIEKLRRRAATGDFGARAALMATAPANRPPAAPAPSADPSTDPYAGLPPLPPDEEYVQDVYV